MKLSLQKHYYSIKYIKNKGILKVRGYYPFELVQGLPNPCFVPYLTAVPPYAAPLTPCEKHLQSLLPPKTNKRNVTAKQ